MQKLEIGQVHPHWQGGEGIKFDFTDAGGVLEMFFDSPTDNEIASIKSGKIQFGIAYLKDIIFLLFKFGSLEWVDIPYTVHLSKPFSMERIEDNTGFAINITLADSVDGKIKVLRLVTMPTTISRAFSDYVTRQMSIKFDSRKYDNDLNFVYSSMSTRDLLKFAIQDYVK